MRPAPITSVGEYAGDPVLVLAATQLGPEHSPARARRVVAEWVDSFSAGPSPVRELRFVTRTPRRLFEALRGQPQLEVLELKWGDYEDLSVLERMQDLHTLRLAGASSVRSLAPLASLQRVRTLSLESLLRAHDLAPLGQMSGVTSLDVGGDWISPRNAHVDSLSFLRRVPQLRRLLLHTTIVDDRDYTPILDLPHLTAVRVMRTRGMRPTFEQLRASTPWSVNGTWPA